MTREAADKLDLFTHIVEGIIHGKAAGVPGIPSCTDREKYDNPVTE